MLTTVLPLVDSYLKNHTGPHFAAFDADGTLWANDVGENFFQYQIDHCPIDVLKTIDPWAHYLELKKKHPPTAYLWLAQICKNFTFSEVANWAHSAAQMRNPELFVQQKQLILELQNRGIRVFVVSASVEWAVAGALDVVGLQNVTAIGVKTKIINSVVTDTQDSFITWREGKKSALLEQTQSVAPMLSCGNTLGDQHLLEISQGLSIAVQSQADNKHHPGLYQDEQGLLQLAHKNKWLHFDFSKNQ